MLNKEINIEIINWFKDQMSAKLSTPRNMKKTHWRRLNDVHLLSRLMEEIDELEAAMAKNGNRSAIISECCDVALLAMMIADNAQNFRGKW